jgi:hypothetical protein
LQGTKNGNETTGNGKIMNILKSGKRFVELNPNPYFGREGKGKGRENDGNIRLKTGSGPGKQSESQTRMGEKSKGKYL